MKVLIAIISLLVFQQTHACMCEGKSALKGEIMRSDVILHGTVINKNIIEENPGERGSIYVEYEVLVQTVYKGNVGNDTIKLYSGTGRSGDCGYRFETGKSYIIYSEFSNEYKSHAVPCIATNRCMRTMLYNEKEERKIKRRKKLLN